MCSHVIACNDVPAKNLTQRKELTGILQHSDSVVFTDHKSLNTGHCLVQNDFVTRLIKGFHGKAKERQCLT